MMTHAERRERRRVLAEAARTAPPRAVALQHGVAIDHVYRSMHEFGVSATVRESQGRRCCSARTLRILATLMQSRDSFAVVGRLHGVTKQRVHQIATAAETAGIVLARKRAQ